MRAKILWRAVGLIFVTSTILIGATCGVAARRANSLLARQEPPAAASPQSTSPQSTPPPTKPPPAADSSDTLAPSPHSVHAHTLKVWTNEDLIGTRTAADVYMFAKEAKAAADQAAAFQTITSCFAPSQPEATPEDTKKAIDETTQLIHETDNGIAQAKGQLADDPEGLRTRDQAELNRRTAERNRLLEQLHTLQDRMQQMTPKSAPETAPAPGSEVSLPPAASAAPQPQ